MSKVIGLVLFVACIAGAIVVDALGIKDGFLGLWLALGAMVGLLKVL